MDRARLTSVLCRIVRVARDESGAAAIMMVLLLSTLLAMVLTSYAVLNVASRSAGRELSHSGQAANIAQSGLVEALDWFRRQEIQPVAAFAPQRDLFAAEPVNETDDPAVGLVRDFRVSDAGNIWGRYVVRKAKGGDPGDAVDVSELRGKSPGSAWRIVSTGMVYIKGNPAVAGYTAGDRILATQTAETEFQRMAIELPAQAAVIARNGQNVKIESKTRIFAPKSGDHFIAYGKSTTKPTVANGGLCADPCLFKGELGEFDTDSKPVNLIEVFGVKKQELQSMADVVANGVSDLPERLPDMSLIVINGNADFSSRPLVGSGVLVVHGNATIGAFSSFTGLIYATGKISVTAPVQVTGTLISEPSGAAQVLLKGSGDFNELTFDMGIIRSLRAQMGQYRIARSVSFSKGGGR